MKVILELLVLELLGAALLALLNSVVLQWRARKLRSWSISFRDAYWISIKAGVVAVIAADAAFSAVIAANAAFPFAGNEEWSLFKNVAWFVWLVSWWFVHTNGVLKLAGPSNLLSPKDARALSANVFRFGFLFVLGGVMVLALVLSALSPLWRGAH